MQLYIAAKNSIWRIHTLIVCKHDVNRFNFPFYKEGCNKTAPAHGVSIFMGSVSFNLLAVSGGTQIWRSFYVIYKNTPFSFWTQHLILMKLLQDTQQRPVEYWSKMSVILHHVLPRIPCVVVGWFSSVWKEWSDLAAVSLELWGCDKFIWRTCTLMK